MQVIYKLEQAPGNSELNIALVQSSGETNVKRGENEGRVLHHINIVRNFKTISIVDQAGEANLSLPNEITAKECRVIVFLQDKGSGEVTSVAASVIK